MRRVHKELHRTSTVHVSLYACITQHTRPAQPRIEATVSMCDTYLCLLYTKASKNRDVQSYHASISTVQSKKKTKNHTVNTHSHFRLTFFLGSSFMHTFFLCIDNLLLNQNFVHIWGSFGKVNKKFKQNFETNKISGFLGRGWYLCVVEYTDFTQYNNKVV